jgi:hypothetical protein
MQQRFRRLALFVGASALVGAGLIMAACGTDNGTSTPVPSVDSGGGGKDSAKTDTGTTVDPDGGITTDGSTADCSSAPQLRTNSAAGGFFCAFYKSDAAVDGAAGLGNCTATQTCCNPGIADGGTFSGKFPPAFCADGKVDETGCASQDTAHGSDFQVGFFSNAWQCNDDTACAAGEKCFMYTSPHVTNPATDKANVGVDTKAPAACHQYKAYKQGGSKCHSGAAATGEVQLCSMNDPGTCGAGTSCQPFDGSGRDLGSCR